MTVCCRPADDVSQLTLTVHPACGGRKMKGETLPTLCQKLHVRVIKYTRQVNTDMSM